MEHGRKLAVLDIDGTLTDSIALHQTAFLSAIESFNFPNLDRNWSGYKHHTDTAIFEEAWFKAYGEAVTAEDRSIFHERLEAEFETAHVGVEVQEIRGATGFVQALRDRGWTVVFATGGLRRLSRSKLKSVGIPFSEEVLITASEHTTRHELVSHAIKAASAQSGSVLTAIVSVGDGLWDMQTAADLGVPFLGVGIGAKADDLQRRGAVVVPDFGDLPSVFSRLESILKATV
jgi:phosphoglycolate phosphatase-like HAD superfamily hydrolase